MQMSLIKTAHMSYLHHLQQTRWVQCWSDRYSGSHYNIRLGNAGRNGCAVPSLTKDEEYAIMQWFGQHNIERDAFHTNMWWCMDKFGFHTKSSGSDTIYQGGIAFRISVDTYNKLFKKD